MKRSASIAGSARLASTSPAPWLRRPALAGTSRSMERVRDRVRACASVTESARSHPAVCWNSRCWLWPRSGFHRRWRVSSTSTTHRRLHPAKSVPCFDRAAAVGRPRPSGERRSASAGAELLLVRVRCAVRRVGRRRQHAQRCRQKALRTESALWWHRRRGRRLFLGFFFLRFVDRLGRRSRWWRWRRFRRSLFHHRWG